MPKLAESFVLDPDTGLVEVDGKEFPYHIGVDVGVDACSGDKLGLHRVRVDLLVDGPVHLWGRRPQE